LGGAGGSKTCTACTIVKYRLTHMSQLATVRIWATIRRVPCQIRAEIGCCSDIPPIKTSRPNFPGSVGLTPLTAFSFANVIIDQQNVPAALQTLAS
jgi:hypothetical protein